MRAAARRLLVNPWWAVTFIALTGMPAGLVAALCIIGDSIFFGHSSFRNPSELVHLAAPLSAFPRQADAELIRVRATNSLLLEERAYARFTWVFQPAGELVLDWGLVTTAVSPNLFDLLGIKPWLGRGFRSDETAVTPRVALISHRVWRDRFGGDIDLLEKEIELPGTLDGKPWRIVGVMPPGFSFPDGSNFWIIFDPSRQPPIIVPDFARLARGVTVSELNAQLPGVTIRPLAEYMTPYGAHAVTFLLVTMGLLLVGGWLHGSSLLLSRVGGVVDTLALKIALGADSWHLRREFAAEGLLLGVACCAVCFATAVSAVPIGLLVLPPKTAFEASAYLSYSTGFAVTAATLIGTAVWVVLVGESVARKRRVPTGLAIGRYRGRGKSSLLLVCLETATASAIIVVGMSAATSYRELVSVDLGFEPRGLLAVPLPVPNVTRAAKQTGASIQSSAHEDRVRGFADSVRSLPGDPLVAFAVTWPTAQVTEPTQMRVGDDLDARLSVRLLTVTAGYTRVIGAKVIEGAEPAGMQTAMDLNARTVEQAAMVNEALAKQLRPFGSVVNQILSSSPRLKFRVYGVIADVKQGRIDQPVDPTLYPFLPAGRTDGVLLARIDPERVQPHTVRQLLPEALSQAAVISLDSRIEEQLAGSRGQARLLGLAASLGLLLLALGTAAVVAEVVRRRRVQIAIRLFLGGSRARVILKTAQGVVVATGFGLVAGLLSGVVIVKWAGAQLFGLAVGSPAILAAAALVVFGAVAATTVAATRHVSDFTFARFLRE